MIQRDLRRKSLAMTASNKSSNRQQSYVPHSRFLLAHKIKLKF